MIDTIAYQGIKVLNRLLQQPNSGCSFSVREWDLCIQQAQSANLLGRLNLIIEQHNLQDKLPSRAINHLNAAQMRCDKQHQDIFNEAQILKQTFVSHNIDFTFLKGAAYVLNGSAHQGRTCSDIDILVARHQIEAAEAALETVGWVPESVSDYDQNYYRQWMHEIPPMIHLARQTILDLHHNIVPLTASKRINAGKLTSQRCASKRASDCYVLSLNDMIIHSSVHLFCEGEFNKGLRDLTDLQLLFNDLFENCLNQSDSANSLTLRAQELGLETSLAYAIRYCEMCLNVEFPLHCSRFSTILCNKITKQPLLDFCFRYVFVPYHSSCTGLRFELACFVLYVRSHLIKMPVKLLLPHLIIKWWQRAKKMFVAN